MKVTPLELPGVLRIEPRVFGDERGRFFESWSAGRYAEAGIALPLVQDNVSSSVRGVLRGLHYQWPGHPQGKLVSTLAGTVWDVVVDVRRGSPTFGRWIGEELSEENHRQLWIPAGYAHGFVVLSERATFHYKVSAPYSPGDEVAIAWDDPTFAIAWPIARPLLSPRDAAAPRFADIPPERIPIIG